MRLLNPIFLSRSIGAPAENLDSAQTDGPTDKRSPLGLVPHQLRGFLGQFRTMLIEGAAYDRCTGCSTKVSSSCPRCLSGDNPPWLPDR